MQHLDNLYNLEAIEAENCTLLAKLALLNFALEIKSLVYNKIKKKKIADVCHFHMSSTSEHFVSYYKYYYHSVEI